jgi:hypothetical protein
MKVIYIPVVIPVNLRTFAALVVCLLGSVLLTVGIATQSWLLLEMRSKSPLSHVSKVVAFQGLQFVDVYVCSASQHFKGDFCDPRHVVYMQCDDATDSWCMGRSGFLVAFASGLIALLLGFASIVTGLIREMSHGIVAGAGAVWALIGIVGYGAGYSTAIKNGILPELLQEAADDMGSVTHHLGFSFYCYLIGTVCMMASAATSLSLRICATHGDENRAMHPPKIQVLHLDAQSTTQLATVAPQPGFVQLNDGRFTVSNDDDGGDDELITSTTQSTAPPTLQPPRETTSPLRREDTLEPHKLEATLSKASHTSDAQ